MVKRFYSIDRIPPGAIGYSDMIERIMMAEHGDRFLGTINVYQDGNEFRFGWENIITGEVEREILIGDDDPHIQALKASIEADKKLWTAFRKGELSAGFVDDIGEMRSIAGHTWSVGHGSVSEVMGSLTDGNQMFVAKLEFGSWLNPMLDEPQTNTKSEKPRKPRSTNTKNDALLRIKIQRVIAAAKKRWPDPQGVLTPTDRDMAKELAKDKDLDYGPDAIRDILRGRYRTQVRLGIPGYMVYDNRD